MVKGSRSNHNLSDDPLNDPSTIEIQVCHFSGVQAAAYNPTSSDDNPTSAHGHPISSDNNFSSGGDIPTSRSAGTSGGGGCFIETAVHTTWVAEEISLLISLVGLSVISLAGLEKRFKK